MASLKRAGTLALALLILGCTVAVAGSYPAGKVIESATMPSSILGKDVQYTVYLPPDYDASTRTYPVFYLLHGGGDDDTAWVHLGDINRIMDKGIAEGKIVPMIVVTPDGRRNPENYPLTYYMNDADGSYRWADMFIQEFIPFFEKEYRVRKSLEVRGIGGLSMGGYAGLMFSMLYPDMFPVTVALSAGMYDIDQIVAFSEGDFDRRYARGFGALGKTGKDRITEQFYKQHPLGIMHRVDVEDLKKLNIFMDCGAEDRFDVGNFEMHTFFKKNNVPHVFTIRTGEHEWKYWREGIKKGMEFASKVFQH